MTTWLESHLIEIVILLAAAALIVSVAWSLRDLLGLGADYLPEHPDDVEVE